MSVLLSRLAEIEQMVNQATTGRKISARAARLADEIAQGAPNVDAAELALRLAGLINDRNSGAGEDRLRETVWQLRLALTKKT